MRDEKFDELLINASSEMANSEAEAMMNAEEADLSESALLRASKLKKHGGAVYIPVKRSAITVLVAAVILALLSTTCLAIPDVREQLGAIIGPKPNMTVEEKLSSRYYFSGDNKYTVYGLEALSDVELNRVAGAGGELYRFLEQIDGICGSSEHSDAILSRLRTPYTVTDLSVDGAYRLRLEELSGAFLTLEGAEEFFNRFSSTEADVPDPELPLFYHLVLYCDITEDELREKNRQETSSILGYPLTENEIRVLTSRDADLVKRELSEDITYLSGGSLYTPYDLAYCDAETFVTLMSKPDFTEHLCRLARTYALDGTDIGSYRDWAIKRYEFFQQELT